MRIWERGNKRWREKEKVWIKWWWEGKEMSEGDGKKKEGNENMRKKDVKIYKEIKE